MHGIQDLTLGLALAVAAMVAALIYGVYYLSRPPSPLRTVVKTMAVGLLAASALRLGLPLLLTVGLALSALGDAFLAGEPKRWLPYGLASFLAAHLAYVALFGTLDHLYPEPLRLAGIAATVAAAGLVLAWLWGSLGALRLPVLAYVVAITAMVATSFMLPHALWPAMAGAVLFFASDGILSAQLFRQRFMTREGQLCVWWFYWFGQLAIAYAFVNR